MNANPDAANPIPLPGAVGELYQISSDEWTAINKQADVAIQLQQIGTVVSTQIPNFTALLAVCSKWESQTYPSFLTQAVLVGTLASSVPQLLSKILDGLASAADGDPLSPNQQFLSRIQFEAFANHAGVLQASAAALAPDIADFVRENQTADVALTALAKRLPIGWSSIAGPLDDLSTGLADLSGGWSSITTQLQALASGQANFATAGVARQAIAAAIPAWNALSQAAVAFDQHATGTAG